jgi:hypothetical protein
MQNEKLRGCVQSLKGLKFPIKKSIYHGNSSDDFKASDEHKLVSDCKTAF